jgi:FAD:protein FMN transferase
MAPAHPLQPMPRRLTALAAFWFGGALVLTAGNQPPLLYRHEANRMSMGCVYAIEAYGPDAETLPRIVEEAFDEVDRIDRLMSHYKTDSPLSLINRDAARRPVPVEPELFDFIVDAMRYNRDSDGAFDITVGPLMRTWGFFRGEGRLPTDAEVTAARRHVGSAHVTLDAVARTISFDEPGVELDLGGIAKGYAVDRVVALLRRRQVAAALISAGSSTIYGLGAPPGAPRRSGHAMQPANAGWDVAIQDPVNSQRAATTVRLKDRALSVAGSSEKSFEAGGVRYSHIMDPRTGRPVQGVLSVAVLTSSGTAGDALDNALFVLGPEGGQAYLNRLPDTEALFFLPDPVRSWTLVHRVAGS